MSSIKYRLFFCYKKQICTHAYYHANLIVLQFFFSVYGDFLLAIDEIVFIRFVGHFDKLCCSKQKKNTENSVATHEPRQTVQRSNKTTIYRTVFFYAHKVQCHGKIYATFVNNIFGGCFFLWLKKSRSFVCVFLPLRQNLFFVLFFPRGRTFLWIIQERNLQESLFAKIKISIKIQCFSGLLTTGMKKSAWNNDRNLWQNEMKLIKSWLSWQKSHWNKFKELWHSETDIQMPWFNVHFRMF